MQRLPNGTAGEVPGLTGGEWDLYCKITKYLESREGEKYVFEGISWVSAR